jgi:hypothetical protein
MAGSGLHEEIFPDSLTLRPATILVLGVRKNSTRAQRIHQHLHTYMRLTAAGDRRQRDLHLDAAIGLGRRRLPDLPGLRGPRYESLGYNLLWFVQIAREHPDALAADATLRHAVEVRYPALRKGWLAQRHHSPREWNPFDSYTQEEQHACWLFGWDEAWRCDTRPVIDDGDDDWFED